MTPTEDDDRTLVDRYKAGSDTAAAELFDKYCERLLHMARRRIGQRLNSRLDPEDVLQSAFRTFFVRVKKDEFTFNNEDDLFKLLVRITVHKTLRQIAFHRAAKRNPNLETGNSDSAHELGVDPGLQKDGVEAHLQVLLAANPHTIAEGLRLVRREYPTDIGPVDLLCRDADGVAVAVEIKRRGDIDGVEQLARYIERLNLDPLLRPVRGVFVAQQIKPQARVLAESRDLHWVEVDYDELRGIESNELRLF